MIVHATIERPTVAAWAAATLGLGLALAWWLRRS